MYDLFNGGWDFAEMPDDYGLEGCPADILADILAAEEE